MSRSQPGAPLYLIGAIDAVEGVLAASYPEPMTARQVADILADRGFRWPLPKGWFRHGDQTVFRQDEYADVTPDRVRRVCEMKGARTDISFEGRRGRAALYSLYPHSAERIKRREASRGRPAG